MSSLVFSAESSVSAVTGHPDPVALDGVAGPPDAVTDDVEADGVA
jgi:hypothetical protein